MHKYAVGLPWVLMVALLAGCPGAQDDAKQDGGVGPAISAKVEPASDDTRVALGPEVTLIVPGGLLSAPATFSSAARTQLPSKIASPNALLGAFELSCDTGSTFEQPLTLEFKYDPADLEPLLDEGKGLSVAFWDTEGRGWTAVPAQADATRHVLIVKTQHLSTWAYWTLRGYKSVTTPEAHFDIYYDPKSTVPLSDGALDMKGFAQRVGELLETAYGAYSAAGFKMPSSWVGSSLNVVLTEELRWAWETWKLGGYNPKYDSET